jgi:hypothetical protein
VNLKLKTTKIWNLLKRIKAMKVAKRNLKKKKRNVKRVKKLCESKLPRKSKFEKRNPRCVPRRGSNRLL